MCVCVVNTCLCLCDISTYEYLIISLPFLVERCVFIRFTSFTFSKLRFFAAYATNIYFLLATLYIFFSIFPLFLFQMSAAKGIAGVFASEKLYTRSFRLNQSDSLSLSL